MDLASRTLVRTRAGNRCEYCLIPQDQVERIRGPLIVGRTPMGRATVATLSMNAGQRLQLRAALIARGLYP
jgi:hypothetical protein